MDENEQGVQVMVKKNPITQLKTNYKELETRFNKWLVKQSLPVEIAVEAAVAAVAGAASSICYNKLSFRSCPLTGPKSLITKARNLAIVTGVHQGIYCAMKRSRGNKEDVQTNLVAGFGAGVMVSLVTGMRGPDVLSVGVFFALLSGGAFQVREKLSHSQPDELFRETGHMLSTLAFDLYEKNLKMGMLTDKFCHSLRTGK